MLANDTHDTTEESTQDNRPLVLKDALFQGEAHSAPYALSVSSPKIEPIDKRMLVANAHESMQHQAEQQISMLKKQAELLMKQAKAIEERLALSHAIYKADINFEPVIHGIYHVYQKTMAPKCSAWLRPTNGVKCAVHLF